METAEQDTILQRRRKLVKISKEEVMLILRAYKNHPTNWNDILLAVKGKLNVLSQEAREIYNSGTAKQLRDRMSTKLSSLVKQPLGEIKDEDIREAVKRIRQHERRLIPEESENPRRSDTVGTIRNHNMANVAHLEQNTKSRSIRLRTEPRPNNTNQTQPMTDRRPTVHRDDIAALMSSDEEELAQPVRPADQPQPAQPAQPAPRRQRPRRRPLIELIRENQEEHNRFIKKKIPKLMRMLGVSSSSEDDE